MTHFSFLILRLKKPIIGLFTLFCFCQTPYAEKKIEHSICFILKKKLPRSYLQGLKVLSIWTWHIDALILDHPTFGHFEAYDLLAHVKIWPLLFGKSHLESLVIQKLVIQQDKNLSFKPFIFNTIYNNNSFKIDKLYLGFVEAPLIPNPLCIHFSRKPLLNFCEIFDLKSHNSLFLEIPRGSGFLKFKAHLAFSQNMITTHLLGHGYIDHTSHLDLKGDMYIDHYKNKIPLDLYFDFDKIFRASGFASSPEFKGFFHLKSDELLAELELNHLKQTTPQSGFDGSILLKAKGL